METSRVSINNKTFFLSTLNVTDSGNPGSKRTLQVSFSGWTPDVSRITNVTVLSIRELDTTENRIEPTQKFIYTALAIDCDCVVYCYGYTDNPDTLLEPLGDRIREATASGVDTSAAEEKYNEARRDIASARARPETQYAEAYNDLDTAKAAISDGETALDKAWAESEIANAQAPINNTDAVIAWLKGNSSTANNPDLAQIIAERDVAANYLSAANDEIANGNYSAAREKAQEAWRKRNESYTGVLEYQDECMGCGGVPFPIKVYFFAGIGVFVLFIAGIFLWMRKTKM